MFRLQLDREDEEKEKEIIRYLGHLNGYKTKTINKIFEREKIKQHPLYTKISSNSTSTWRSFSFHHERVSCVGKVLGRHDVKCSFKTKGNILNHLKHTSNQDEHLSRSGVYRIQCDDCSAFYLGETGRSVRTRTNEHRKTRLDSAFGRHLNFKDENIRLLHEQHKGFRLTLLEAYEIWRERGNNNLLNEQVELKREPLFKTCR